MLRKRIPILNPRREELAAKTLAQLPKSQTYNLRHAVSIFYYAPDGLENAVNKTIQEIVTVRGFFLAKGMH